MAKRICADEFPEVSVPEKIRTVDVHHIAKSIRDRNTFFAGRAVRNKNNVKLCEVDALNAENEEAVDSITKNYQILLGEYKSLVFRHNNLRSQVMQHGLCDSDLLGFEDPILDHDLSCMDDFLLDEDVVAKVDVVLDHDLSTLDDSVMQEEVVVKVDVELDND